jgi:hypothetical protein
MAKASLAMALPPCGGLIFSNHDLCADTGLLRHTSPQPDTSGRFDRPSVRSNKLSNILDAVSWKRVCDVRDPETGCCTVRILKTATTGDADISCGDPFRLIYTVVPLACSQFPEPDFCFENRWSTPLDPQGDGGRADGMVYIQRSMAVCAIPSQIVVYNLYSDVGAPRG